MKKQETKKTPMEKNRPKPDIQLPLLSFPHYHNMVPAVISLSALFPEEIASHFFPSSAGQTEKIRTAMIRLLPQEYRILRPGRTAAGISSGSDLLNCESETLDCFWNGNTQDNPEADNLFFSVRDSLLLKAPTVSSELHGFIRQLKPVLQELLKSLPAGLRSRYQKEIQGLCELLKNSRGKFSGFSSVDFCRTFPVLKGSEDPDEDAFLITLAHLVMIACTSSVWCKPEKNTRTCADQAGQQLFPCLCTNILPFTYHDGFTELPRICWSTLFPAKFLNAYQKAAGRSRTPATTEWFQTFIPDGYQLKDNSLFVTGRAKTSFSNYWGGKSEGNACCKCIGENIIREGKKLSGRFEALLRHITEKCRTVLDVFDGEYLAMYEQDLDVLYQRLCSSRESSFSFADSRFRSVKDGCTKIQVAAAFQDRPGSGVCTGNPDFAASTGDPDFAELPDAEELRQLQLQRLSGKLALLIPIAATWTVWASPENKDLAKALFAVISREEKSAEDEDDTLAELSKAQSKTASDKLTKAKTAFHNRDFSACDQLCREILALHLAEDEILGDAYYYLVCCHEDYDCHEGYYDKKEFQYRALDLGSKEAREKWSARHLDSLLYIPKPGTEADSEVVFNAPADNGRVRLFLQSRPEADAQAAAHYARSAEDFSAYIQPGRCIRFLLIHDSFEKNYLDLLYILNAVKNWNRNHPGTPVFSDDAWKTCRIYVRLNENSFASLLDTALKHMDGILVPVYLIDDAKRTAQGLLYQFPLFYPIRTLSAGILSQRQITLNLNIISERSDDLTNWLIREAYWLGCFCYTGITLAVNIISPEIRKIISRLEYDCPGIFHAIPEDDRVSKIVWNYSADSPAPLKSAKNSGTVSLESLESGELFQKLGQLRKPRNCYSYYIVNCADDLASLNLAVKIREWEIRQLVRSSSAIKMSNLPVITYHCENPDLAHMAESMVVHQEAYGDSWYNNYFILPFGSSQYYHWDAIDGGYTEKISQCVHLQYSACDVNASEAEKDAALEDYFTRCYNRDSSMAVALSMPYRLFQMASPGADHILPFGWALKNKAAFSDPLSLEAMAAQAEAYTNKEELLYYERARWMRYMISRGWQRATAEETIKFMRAGNPRRQLYIGLLHGCIGSLEELRYLQRQLYQEYQYGLVSQTDQRFAGNDPRQTWENGKEKEVFDKYYQYDISSLNQTADIIRTSWFPKKERELFPPDEAVR